MVINYRQNIVKQRPAEVVLKISISLILYKYQGFSIFIVQNRLAMSISKAFSLLLVAALFFVAAAFTNTNNMQQSLKGSWSRQSGDTSHLLICTDGYLSHSAYIGNKFLFTHGGPFTVNGSTLQVKWEYDSANPDNVGQTGNLTFAQSGGGLSLGASSNAMNAWKQEDNGNGPLNGNWRITQRMQEGKLQTIHQSGTRKTVKLLTGSKFQWVAIDPAAKGFYGTGGGRYTFENGKYTEHIEFFSRDNNRVGAALEFTGKVENGDWHHSGKSSNGSDIYEVWSRK